MVVDTVYGDVMGCLPAETGDEATDKDPLGRKPHKLYDRRYIRAPVKRHRSRDRRVARTVSGVHLSRGYK